MGKIKNYIEGIFKIAWAVWGIFVYSKIFALKIELTLMVFLGFYCALSLIFSAQFRSKFLKSVLAFIYIFLPSLSAGYFLSTRAFFNSDMLYAVYQTSPAEAFEYCRQFLSWPVLIYPVLLIIFLIVIKKVENKDVFPTRQKILFLLMALIGAGFVPETKLIYTSFFAYQTAIKGYQATAIMRQARQDICAITKAFSDEIHVVVFGESLNRNHMSLYGYPRKTTPNLDRQPDIFVFKDMISSDMNTPKALEQAITLADDENRLSYLDVPSAIELSKAAGFKTYWISNQQIVASQDTLVTVLVSPADEKYFLNQITKERNGSRSFDGILVEKLHDIILKDAQVAQPRLIFIHLLGSHTFYKDRYPARFDFFKFSKTDPLYAKKNKIMDPDVLDQYDNSVLYTDYVLSEMIRVLAETGRPATLTFLGDHGEDVLRNRGHNNTRPSKAMVEIPFLVWVSPEYHNQNPTIVKTLQQATPIALKSDIFDQFLFLLLKIEMPGKEIQYRLPSSKQKNQPRQVVENKYDYHALPD